MRREASLVFLKTGWQNPALVFVEGVPHSFHPQPKERDLRPLLLGFSDAHLKQGPAF